MNLITLSYLSRFCLIIVILLSLSSPATAGTLYRFMEEGQLVLSHRLPASAAQSGYDVLDGKTLRLIKHVDPALTPAQRTEKQTQIKQQIKQAEDAELLRIQAAEAKKEQDKYDRTLLATYPREQDLIEHRDAAIAYRENNITETKKRQIKLKDHLTRLQIEAANDEIAGKPISENHYKRIQITQDQLDYNNTLIAKLTDETHVLTAKYAKEQERLQFLLKSKQ